MQRCHPLTTAGLDLQASREASPSGLAIADLRCSERFATEVRCGNRSYLFSRHDMGDHRWFETLVRTAQPGQPYSAASVGIGHGFLMSHNAAIICRVGRLHAYGGMSHNPRGADWHGGDVGIMHSVAEAGAPPLVWSTPKLVVSGKPATGCVDEVKEGPECEFDGKVSAVRYRGEVLLFTRSNLSNKGGARHVQVTRSRDGVSGWSRFEQLSFDGLRGIGQREAACDGLPQSSCVGQSEANIYFLALRVLPGEADGGGGSSSGGAGGRRGAVLFGLFPGHLGGEAGVFGCTSHDGVRWSRPVRLLASAAEAHWRTRDYPLDGSLLPQLAPETPSAATGPATGAAAGPAVRDGVRLVVQLGVDLRDYHADAPQCMRGEEVITCAEPPPRPSTMDTDCASKPGLGASSFCAYVLSGARLRAMRAPAAALPTSRLRPRPRRAKHGKIARLR